MDGMTWFPPPSVVYGLPRPLCADGDALLFRVSRASGELRTRAERDEVRARTVPHRGARRPRHGQGPCVEALVRSVERGRIDEQEAGGAQVADVPRPGGRRE